MPNKEVHIGDDWYLDENNDGDLIFYNARKNEVVKAIDVITGAEDKKGNSINNVSSESLSNPFGIPEILGKSKIAVINSNGVSIIDPSNYTNPIQQAWDIANNEGYIYYPPVTIEYPGNLSGAGGIIHKAPRGTTFLDTDETSPSYAPSGTSEGDCFFEGITWKNQTTPRTANGFVFDSTYANWNLGLGNKFVHYTGADLFDWTSGSAYSSVWLNPRASQYDRFIHCGTAHAPFQLISPYLNSDDKTTPEIKYESNISAKIIIKSWNKGRTACPLIETGIYGSYWIGSGNWEPATDSGAIDYIIWTNYHARLVVEPFSLGGNFTLNKEHIIGKNIDGGDITIRGMHNTFGVTSFHKTDPGIVVAGPSSNVNNRTGSLLDLPITCLGDVVKKKSTGTGYDGGTNDTKL